MSLDEIKETNDESVSVALVGYGYAGKTFHAPLIVNVHGMNLTTVVSSDPAKVAGDLPKMVVVAHPDEAFANEHIELVVIASPNDTHFDLAKRALNAGKHVVVDKPFTTTCGEAKELIALSKSNNKILAVFHNRRWDADFLTLRELLAQGVQGSLGEVMHFESRFDRYRPEVRQRWREQAGAGTGIWFDLGSHLVDQALQLFGVPDRLQADLELQRDDATAVDYFHVVLHYGKMRAILHGSALVAAESPRFTVHGKLGSYIKFGLDTQEDALKHGDDVKGSDWGVDPKDGTLTVCGNGKAHESLVSTSRGNYRAYYEGIRDAIRHGAPNPVPPEDALRVMEMLELGLESSSSGKVLDVYAALRR